MAYNAAEGSDLKFIRLMAGGSMYPVNMKTFRERCVSVKAIPEQAVEVHTVVRCRGSHIFPYS
jgi:hypothetical protein